MINPLDRISLAELRLRTSIKWSRYPADVLPAWVAEMDTRLAEPIAEALTEAVRLGDTGYPVADRYAPALAGFAQDRWGWSFDVRHTSLVPDVMQGVVEVLKLITRPGDRVVMNPPVYTPFYQFVYNLGREIGLAPLGPDGRIDFAALEESFVDARAYLLCNPHNPTGTVHTRAELTRVAELARRYNVRIVADEIHAPLVYAGAEFTPILTVPGAENAFSLMSASKAFNLAGLKAALAIAGPGSEEELARIPEEVHHGASHLGVLAHVAAYRYCGEWLDALLTGLDANRRLFGELLAQRLPQVRYGPPQGTYLSWVDCRALGWQEDPADVFLRRGRLGVNSGVPFGVGGEGHVRINLATSPTLIEEIVERMAASM